MMHQVKAGDRRGWAGLVRGEVGVGRQQDAAWVNYTAGPDLGGKDSSHSRKRRTNGGITPPRTQKAEEMQNMYMAICIDNQGSYVFINAIPNRHLAIIARAGVH